MVGFISETSGGNYTPTPEGPNIMICSRVIDLGTQPGSQQFPTPKRKIRIFWELPNERMEWEVDGVKHEGPVLHSEQYTVSFHEKSNLRKDLESWRGKAFTQEDLSGPPNGFHLSKLIGIPALGQIVHDDKGGKIYANLNSIMRPEKESFEKHKGKIEGSSLFFSFDEFNQEVFDQLSDRLKETIQKSPEYQSLFGQSSSQSGEAVQSENPGHGISNSDPEDDTPF